MLIKYEVRSNSFMQIPGSPVAYWASEKIFDSFKNELIENVCSPKCGLKTGITEKYVLCWQEVSVSKIGFHYASRDEAKISKKKWFPASDGQEFRKWYGNNYDVVFGKMMDTKSEIYIVKMEN